MITVGEKLAFSGGKPVRTAPYPPHTILGEEERREVAEVLDSAILSGFIARAGANFLGGPKVRLLEEEFERYFGAKYAVSTNSATSCLHSALAALGCGPGDEVIVTPFTMSASATAVLMCNSIPIFADVDPIYGNIDPEKVRHAITPRTRAIVVVHLFGHPAPMDELLAIANEAKLPIVEDCAQAPAAIYKGRYTGTMGSIGVFSFNQFKTISCGEGGISITDDDDLAERMQLVRNHGECMVGEMRPEDAAIIGYNYRPTELNSAVALAQFRKLDRLTDHRIALADYLTGRLTGMPGLDLPVPAPDCRHVYFLYPLRFDESIWGISRELFVEAMQAEGIPVAGGYAKPLHLLPFYQARLTPPAPGACSFQYPRYDAQPNYAQGNFPNAETLHAKRIVTTLLCRYPLANSDMDEVCKAIEKIWKSRQQLSDRKQ